MDWTLGIAIGALVIGSIAGVATNWQTIKRFLPSLPSWSRSSDPDTDETVQAFCVVWRHVERVAPDEIDGLEPYFRLVMQRERE